MKVEVGGATLSCLPRLPVAHQLTRAPLVKNLPVAHSVWCATGILCPLFKISAQKYLWRTGQWCATDILSPVFTSGAPQHGAS